MMYRIQYKNVSKLYRIDNIPLYHLYIFLFYTYEYHLEDCVGIQEFKI